MEEVRKLNILESVRRKLARIKIREKPITVLSPVSTIQKKITSSSKIEYFKMLDRGYKKLIEIEAHQYIKIRSAKLVEEMDSYSKEGNIRVAIINFEIEFVKKEIDKCQKKLSDSDNKIGKEYYLPKGQRRRIKIRMINLEYNLKNLFKQRDLIFICL